MTFLIFFFVLQSFTEMKESNKRKMWRLPCVNEDESFILTVYRIFCLKNYTNTYLLRESGQHWKREIPLLENLVVGKMFSLALTSSRTHVSINIFIVYKLCNQAIGLTCKNWAIGLTSNNQAIDLMSRTGPLAAMRRPMDLPFSKGNNYLLTLSKWFPK